MSFLFKKTSVVSFILANVFFMNAFASTTVTSDSNKRISIPISLDSVNRIVFSNDRISQVFGDEETYAIQSDETLGQIFLKPSELNGTKPISLTITTEKNVVQDLELLPKEISSQTINIKNDKKMEGDHTNQKYTPYPPYMSEPNFAYNASYRQRLMNHNPHQDYTNQIVSIVKTIASQRIEPSSVEDEKPPTLKIPDLKIEGVRVVDINRFKVLIYKLSNEYEKISEISEYSFPKSIEGCAVCSVAFEKNMLHKGDDFHVFVVIESKNN